MFQQRPSAPDAAMHGIVEAVVGDVPHEYAQEGRLRKGLQAEDMLAVIRPWPGVAKANVQALARQDHEHWDG